MHGQYDLIAIPYLVYVDVKCVRVKVPKGNGAIMKAGLHTELL